VKYLSDGLYSWAIVLTVALAVAFVSMGLLIGSLVCGAVVALCIGVLYRRTADRWRTRSKSRRWK